MGRRDRGVRHSTGDRLVHQLKTNNTQTHKRQTLVLSACLAEELDLCRETGRPHKHANIGIATCIRFVPQKLKHNLETVQAKVNQTIPKLSNLDCLQAKETNIKYCNLGELFL